VCEEHKAKAIYDVFNDIMGTSTPRVNVINLDLLELSCHNLFGLGERFTEDEVFNVIRSLPPDKVPGPNGFTGHFLQSAWSIIRRDLILVFDAFWHMDTKSFHSVNEALLTRLPKTMEAAFLKDHRLILLIHTIG
jgi:hypothetical protein